MSSAPQADRPSYEQARDELVEVVRHLESGGVPLEESLALWERGERLATVCQEWLTGAKAKVDAAQQAAEGEQSRAPSAEGRDPD